MHLDVETVRLALTVGFLVLASVIVPIGLVMLVGRLATDMRARARRRHLQRMRDDLNASGRSRR
jgi:hypothetical protein